MSSSDTLGRADPPSAAQPFRLPMTSNDIRRLLPQRSPFLFLDRVVELTPGRRAVGIKNVTISESCFSGHFPDDPILPGVLILETAAQLCGVVMATGALVSDVPGSGDLAIAYLAGVKRMRFRSLVRPGDQLVLETRRKAQLGAVVDYEVVGRVNGAIVVDGIITLAGMGPGPQDSHHRTT